MATDEWDGIILEPGNRLEDDKEELETAMTELRRLLPDVPVRTYERPDAGYGVTLWHVVHYWVPWDAAEREVLGDSVRVVIETMIRGAWDRVRREKEAHPENPRTVYRDLYGPNGEVIKAIRIDPGGDLVDVTADPREHAEAGRRWPFKRRD